MALRIEPRPIVGDGQLQPAIAASQGNRRAGRSGMAADIAQPFLGDAKEAERGIAWHRADGFLRLHLELGWAGSRKAVALGPQCLDQAEIFQDRGMQSIRQACTSSLKRTSPSRMVRIAAPRPAPAGCRSS